MNTFAAAIAALCDYRAGNGKHPSDSGSPGNRSFSSPARRSAHHFDGGWHGHAHAAAQQRTLEAAQELLTLMNEFTSFHLSLVYPGNALEKWQWEAWDGFSVIARGPDWVKVARDAVLKKKVKRLIDHHTATSHAKTQDFLKTQFRGQEPG